MGFFLLTVEYSHDNFTKEKMTSFFSFNREIISPLNQFEIFDLLSFFTPILGNLQISVTNIGLYLICSALIFILLNILATNKNKITSNS